MNPFLNKGPVRLPGLFYDNYIPKLTGSPAGLTVWLGTLL
ncbi:hypothetical protein SAMN05428988_1542 [Chitinophaga sp. YR573]|nr:hypothetical protein SAMN05428988_1542 [Chitinophaga sp. YR573]